MPDLKTDWSYPTIETTLDKRLERPGVKKGFSSELTGVDGRSEGGLNPFPGFRKVHTMTSLQSQAGHGVDSVVLDFKAIDFRIGSEFYGYGFVYRAARSGGSAADVFIDYWDSANQTWTRCQKIMDSVGVDGQFDVQVAGRFVYCFLEGRSPALFYIEATRTKEYPCEADAYLDAANTSTNYGSVATLQVKGVSAENRALLRFNTSDAANKTVESATLSFTVSGNVASSAVTLTVNPVTDPGASNADWNETQVTWLNRKTGTTWSTAGGSYNSGVSATTTVSAGSLGRVSMDLKTITQGGVSSTYQSFSDKTDIIVRSSDSTVISLPARSQANYGIRPTLTVTYTDKVFLNPVVVGLSGTTPIPGPGKQPSLSSPERGIAPGTFTTIDAGRPASGQIILISDDPYTNDNYFPDQVSGLCAADSFPGGSTPAVPGTPGTHTPTGSACSDMTGIVNQLLTPANRQTNVSVKPRLDWTTYYTSGAVLDANVVWDVYMVEDRKGNLNDHRIAGTATTGISTTYFEPASLFSQGRLAYGKKYLWKVAAKRTDCGGTGAQFYVESLTGSFTTENRFKARKFEPGDYSFGYVLVSSKTGRKSAFSQVAQVRSEDFVVARTQNGTTISVKQDQYMGIELVYDSSKYDQMYVYRSVKIQDAGGTMVAGLPFLDAIITLTDYQTCQNGTGRTFDPASTDNRHAMYFYELEDKQLVYQNPYTDRSVFDETMPYGGAAMFYQNTMLVSKVQTPAVSTTDESRYSDAGIGLGEMRWSSMMDLCPELFPPFNRYNPTVPSNEVICFAKAGGNVVGLSRDKVYHLRKSGPYVKVTEMHEGYGVVNHKAVDSVGSAAYFVTSHGLKSVDMQGQLDEIRNLNLVMVREWKDDLASVQVAYDPYMNALFVHNPVQEETYVLWFSTSNTTKIADTNFAHISQGSWPINFTGAEYGNELCRRSFFLQNVQETRAGGIGYGVYAGPAVYVVDQAGDRTISGGSTSWNGQRRITTLDFNGDSRFVASGAWSSGSIPISTATGTVVLAAAWQYVYVYLVASTANAANVGKKAKVMYNYATNVYIDSTVYPWVTSTVAGDVFVVSPVPFEWAGSQIGMENEQGMVFSSADLFRMKIVSSIGSAFTDVSGPPLTDTVTAGSPLARFTGVLYSGTSETPLATALTKDTNGNLYASVEDDEGLVYAAFGSDASNGKYGAKGTALTPAIRILCPDLEFRLLGCIVRGTITSVERTTNIRGS